MKLKKGVLVQKMGDKYVVFDNDTSTLHELNESAHFIVDMIRRGMNSEKIVSELVIKYKIDEKIARSDYEEIVRDLLDKELLIIWNSSVKDFLLKIIANFDGRESG